MLLQWLKCHWNLWNLDSFLKCSMSFSALADLASKGSLLLSLETVQSLPYAFQEHFLSWGGDIFPQSRTLNILCLEKGWLLGRPFLWLRRTGHNKQASDDTYLCVYKPWGTLQLSVAGAEASQATWGSRNLWRTDGVGLKHDADLGFALACPILGGPGLAQTLLENADESSNFSPVESCVSGLVVTPS